MPTYVGDALLAHAKAGCYRCSRGDSLIDLDVLIEGEGALVLCKGCIAEAAEAAGMLFNEAYVAEIKQEAASARATYGPERVAELEAQLAAAQAEVLVLNSVIAQHINKPATPAKAPKAKAQIVQNPYPKAPTGA